MLDTILDSVRARLPDVVAAGDELRAAAADAAPPRSLAGALSVGGLQVIAEIKRRSPSAGALAPELDPADQARRYAEGGAAAISVLTEPDHFAGSLADLEAVRAAVDLPLLRKDFVLHPAQIWEARSAGADAVLLIVAALGDSDLEHLLATADAAGCDALVEAHTAREADRAMSAGAAIVGVNNRDLSTFRTDLATAETVAGRLGQGTVRVAESGVSNEAGAARMAAAGYHAILVGEALVRSPEPAALIGRLLASVAREAP